LKWLGRHPEAARAHRILHAALHRGILKRRPCSLCGGLGTHAHHESYSRPLDVVWFCRWCHHEHHRLERKYGKGQMTFSFIMKGRP
jgi:hypothetical protein